MKIELEIVPNAGIEIDENFNDDYFGINVYINGVYECQITGHIPLFVLKKILNKELIKS